MANLQDLSNQLAKNNEQNVIGHERTSVAVSGMSRQLGSFIAFLKGQRLDDLEKSREAKPPKISQRPASGPGTDQSGINFIPGLLSLKGLIASITAFTAALSGLRGWEVNAIKAIGKGLGNFADAFKTSSLRILDDFKVRLGTRFSGILETISTRLTRYVNLILENLGIAKFEQLRNAAGRFTGERLTPLNKIGKFFENVTEALKPVTRIATTLGKVTIFPLVVLLEEIASIFGKIGGFAGGKTMSAISTLAGKFTGFVGLAAKILKPIGFIFSFVEGMSEAFKTEGDLVDKLSAGVSRFLADFFGAPLDLLKDLGAWLLKKMGFQESAESLQKFSIEEFLFDTLQGVFKFIRRAFEDPVGLGKDILGGIVGSIKSLFNSVMKSIAAGFGIELKTEEEKLQETMEEANAELTKRAARLNTLLQFNQRENAALDDLEYQLASGQITQREYNQAINRGVIKGNAEVGFNASQRASQLRMAREEYQAATEAAEAAKLAYTQITNQTSVSTATQPILVSPGQAWNPSDIMVQGAR